MDLTKQIEQNPLVIEQNQQIQLKLIVNEVEYELQVSPTEKLVSILRDHLKLTGTKLSCSIGRCGACSVLIDDVLVNACLMMAYQVQGKSITTIEGLGGVTLDEVQQAFLTEGGFQCGYCTSGMIISTKYLLARNPNPTENDIKEALAGNICRCTGYGGIIRAVQSLVNKKEKNS